MDTRNDMEEKQYKKCIECNDILYTETDYCRWCEIKNHLKNEIKEGRRQRCSDCSRTKLIEKFDYKNDGKTLYKSCKSCINKRLNQRKK